MSGPFDARLAPGCEHNATPGTMLRGLDCQTSSSSAASFEPARSTFKQFLSAMPEVGADDDLVPPRDPPRDIGHLD
jgi:hypothetical protein